MPSRPSRQRRPCGLAAAAAVVLGVSAACGAGGPRAVATFPVTAAPAVSIAAAGCAAVPVLALPGTGGLPAGILDCLGPGAGVDLSRLRGPAVVNVWASWCGPCLEELPVIARFAAATPTVAVVGVDYEDHGRAAAVAELSRSAVRYPSVVDPRGRIGVAGVPPLPSTFFVDASGRVVFHQPVPYRSVGALRADARRYLGVGAG